jgi:thiol-disulfide isomerase/thioredoxin
VKQKHKIYLRIGGTLLFLIVFIKCIDVLITSSSSQENVIGQMIPIEILEDKDGKRVDKSIFQEEPTVLVFTASWCPACQRLEKILKNFPGRVWGIAYQDPQIFKNMPSSFQRILMDPQGKLAALWKIQGIPTMLVIDRQGKVVWQHNGALTKSRIESELIPFLKSCKEDKCP